jgi:hypothetical protein
MPAGAREDQVRRATEGLWKIQQEQREIRRGEERRADGSGMVHPTEEANRSGDGMGSVQRLGEEFPDASPH